MTSRVRVRRYVHMGWLGLATISAGCVSTGTRVDEAELQNLLANDSSLAVVEQRLGAPYAKHFVSADRVVGHI